MKIVHAEFGKPSIDLAPDFSAVLRELADAVDAGEIGGACVIVVRNGEYELHFPSSLSESLIMSTLLHRRATDKFLA